MKTMIWAGMFVGSFVGGWVPTLWGDSVFSLASVILTAVGGVAGIFGAYHLGRRMGL